MMAFCAAVPIVVSSPSADAEIALSNDYRQRWKTTQYHQLTLLQTLTSTGHAETIPAIRRSHSALRAVQPMTVS
jgi:hypothetical protein